MRFCPQCKAPMMDDRAACPSCGAAAGVALQDPFLGMAISDKFLLQEVIGSGGMGKVYRAEQLGIGRTVAVKIMHRHLMGDETAGARFTNEARAASQLNHPNSISVLDFGQTKQGFLYIVYEYLRGRSLDVVLRQSFPLPVGRIVDILVQTTDAVEAAHGLGIIHRDLKPENVFLVQSGGGDFVKVLDFGIAKITAYRDRSITSPGMVPGTPEYMSPEQAKGEPLDPRSDVYALGVVLYELLTATVPFKGPSIVATMMSHVQDPPEPPSKRRPDGQIPPELDRLVLWALAKRPCDRISSALEFGGLLQRWAAQAGIQTRGAAAAAAPREAQPAAFQDLRGAAGGPVALPVAPPLLRDRMTQPQLALVGRDAELKRLAAFLEGAAADGALLCLHGEAGMGASRLIRETISLARSTKREVIHCQPDSGWSAGVLGAAQRVALKCLGLGEGSSNLEDLLLAASQLGLAAEEVPGLKELFGIPSHLSEMNPESRRRERDAAFRSLVQRAAARRPLLVIFEGLQLYDEPSRALAVSLAAHVEAPLAVMLTSTPELDLPTLPKADQLELGPLAPRESAALVRLLFEDEVNPLWVDRVCRAARGQPLFLEQLAFAQLLDGRSEVPERLADLVAMRTECLAQTERELLQWMAVINDWLTPRQLRHLCGKPVDQALLTQLVERGVVQVRPEDGRYYFMHRLVAMVVYSSIPAEVRRQMHRRVAEQLRRGDASVQQVALHAYEADDGWRAIEELDQAGTLASQCLDQQTASRWYSQALDMVRREWGKARVPEKDLEQQAVGLAQRLARALSESGQLQMARAILEEALSVAAANAVSRAALRLELGRIDLALGNLQRAVRHLELASNDAQVAQSSFLQGEVLCELGRVVGVQGDKARASQLIVASLAASTKASGQRGEPDWHTLVDLATTCLQVGLPERARGYLLDALDRAETACSILGKLQVLRKMAEVHQSCGEWDEAEIRLTQAFELAAQIGDRSVQANIRTALGRLRRIQGDVEEGRRQLERALALAREVDYVEELERVERELEMLRYAVPRSL